MSFKDELQVLLDGIDESLRNIDSYIVTQNNKLNSMRNQKKEMHNNIYSICEMQEEFSKLSQNLAYNDLTEYLNSIHRMISIIFNIQLKLELNGIKFEKERLYGTVYSHYNTIYSLKNKYGVASELTLCRNQLDVLKSSKTAIRELKSILSDLISNDAIEVLYSKKGYILSQFKVINFNDEIINRLLSSLYLVVSKYDLLMLKDEEIKNCKREKVYIIENHVNYENFISVGRDRFGKLDEKDYRTLDSYDDDTIKDILNMATCFEFFWVLPIQCYGSEKRKIIVQLYSAYKPILEKIESLNCEKKQLMEDVKNEFLMFKENANTFIEKNDDYNRYLEIKITETQCNLESIEKKCNNKNEQILLEIENNMKEFSANLPIVKKYLNSVVIESQDSLKTFEKDLEIAQSAINNNIEEYIKNSTEKLFKNQKIREIYSIYDSYYRGYDYLDNRKPCEINDRIVLFYCLKRSSFRVNKRSKEYINKMLGQLESEFKNLFLYEDDTLMYKIPFLFSLDSNSTVLLKVQDSQDQDKFDNLAQRMIMSVINGIPSGLVRFMVISHKRAGVISNLNVLNKIEGLDVPIITQISDKNDIIDNVKNLNKSIQDFQKVLCSRNIPYYKQINRRDLKNIFTFLVLLDYPYLYKDKDKEVDISEDLVGLLNNGPQCGVFTFIFNNQKGFPLHDIKINIIKVENFESTLNGKESLPIYYHDYDALNRESIIEYKKIYKEALIHDSKISVSCSIPIGNYINGEEANLFFDETCIHYLILGNSGSGKSNLLKTIAYNSIIGSNDIELYLADLKMGVGFSDFLNLKHPKVKMVIAEDNSEVLAAFIHYVKTDLMRDLQLDFSRARVDNWRDYNRNAAQNGVKPIPARLIIIDEYQNCQPEDSEQFQEDMEVILREGRAFNIHVILATQYGDSMAEKALPRRTLIQAKGRIAFDNKSCKDLFGQKGENLIFSKHGDMYISHRDNSDLELVNTTLFDNKLLDTISPCDNSMPIKIFTEQINLNIYSSFYKFIIKKENNILLPESNSLNIPIGNDASFRKVYQESIIQMNIGEHLIFHGLGDEHKKSTFQLSYFATLLYMIQKKKKNSIAIICSNLYAFYIKSLIGGFEEYVKMYESFNLLTTNINDEYKDIEVIMIIGCDPLRFSYDNISEAFNDDSNNKRTLMFWIDEFYVYNHSEIDNETDQYLNFLADDKNHIITPNFMKDLLSERLLPHKLKEQKNNELLLLHGSSCDKVWPYIYLKDDHIDNFKYNILNAIKSIE